MSSGERFSGYPCELGYATTQVLQLAQVQAIELDANVTEMSFVPAGAVKPTAILTSRARPEFRLRTQDIATVLSVIDFNTGKCFDETSTFWLQERADCGTFLTTATQPGRTTENAFAFIESITSEAESDDGAIVSVRFVPLKASGTDIVVFSTSLDPDTDGPTPAFTSGFYHHSPYHNGGEWKGTQSVTINTGIQIQPTPSTPGCFDEKVSIIKYEPEIIIRSLKVDDFDAFQLTGNPLTSSWAQYLQRIDVTNAVGNGRVSVGASSHVKISGTAGKITVRNLSFEGNDDAGVEVSIKPTGAITASTASTIP